MAEYSTRGAFKYYISTFGGGVKDMTRNAYIQYAIYAFLGGGGMGGPEFGKTCLYNT